MTAKNILASKVTKTIASVATAAGVLAGGAVGLGVLSTGAAHAATTESIQANTVNYNANVAVLRWNGSTWNTVANTTTDAKGRFYIQEPVGYWYSYTTSKVTQKYTGGSGFYGMTPCTIFTYGNVVYADPSRTAVTVPFYTYGGTCF